MPGGDVDKKQLVRYIELEREIQGLEAQNVLKTYELRKKAVDDVSETINSVKRTLDVQVKQTIKEKADVDQTIRSMFKDDNTFKKELSREQEEYLEAKNKEEVTRQQLDGLTKQHSELEAKAKEVAEPAEKLKNLYEERDTLLSTIFDGEYGSDLENKLEAQFDVKMEKKQRISVAHYKWNSARVLLQHAVSQMQHAVAKWAEVGRIDTKNMQGRYGAATEARNNLVAAMQNIQSTQRYLSSITFPYCEPQEMETLQRATNNIYTDMQCNDRHGHAMQCYTVTMKRAGALLQWFDNVIQETINKDMQSATLEARKVEQELRAERIRLIRSKVEESGESTKDLNVAEDTPATPTVDQHKLSDADLDMNGIGITRPEGVASDPNLPDMQTLSMEEEFRPPPTPIPMSQLAPKPSNEDLFGDISELKEQHKKNTDEFNKAQEMNKARMEQGLQAKLMERRHRKKNF